MYFIIKKKSQGNSTATNHKSINNNNNKNNNRSNSFDSYNISDKRGMAGSNQKAGWAQRMKSFQSKQSDINRLIMKHLVTEGYMDAAQRFEAEAKLETGEQLDTLEYRMHIRNAVRAGQVQYAMDMAKKLYPKLYESENYMYFHMQQLRLLELIRERKSDPSDMERTLTLPSASQASCRQQMSSELDSMSLIEQEQTACMDPKMMFLVQLILWAQGKLDRDAGAAAAALGAPGLDNYDEFDGDDFELELKRALDDN